MRARRGSLEMEILYLMVPLGMVLVGLGIWAFFWAVGSGQFDDLDSPGWSVLGDDDQGEADTDPNVDRDPRSPPPHDRPRRRHGEFGAALVAGLAGSGHCLAMCGGVAGALAMRGNAAGTGAGTADRARARPRYLARRELRGAGALAGLLGRALAPPSTASSRWRSASSRARS